MSRIHHRQLPNRSVFLCGRAPPDSFGFKSDRLQIIFNSVSEPCKDDHPHLHTLSDEVYIVLEGAMQIEVDGTVATVRATEFLCVASGIPHQVVGVNPPAKWLVVRAPSIDDKTSAS